MSRVDFILKWTATAILIIGTAVNSLGYYPLGPIILFVSGILWLIVSIKWREPSLIVVNGATLMIALAGLIYKLW